jgi:hypothetical protein
MINLQVVVATIRSSGLRASLAPLPNNASIATSWKKLSFDRLGRGDVGDAPA